MDRQTARRWLRNGLVVGTAVAVASSRYRSRTEPKANDTRAITERHADAFLLDRRIESGRADAIVDHVDRTVSGADPDRVLGIDGASTATLFLDRSGDDPALVWYVEVPRGLVDEWADPQRTVADAFPISHDALEAPDEPADRTLLVHAANPTRPRSIAAGGRSESGPLEAPPDGAFTDVDVELVRMRLRPGVPERLADWFARSTQRVIAGELDLDRIGSWSGEMLDAERMYTESIFLERDDEGYVLYQYMEADEMRAVYDAYYDTRNPVARASEFLLGRALREPERILEYPLETGVERLAHVVDPNRPRRADDGFERNR